VTIFSHVIKASEKYCRKCFITFSNPVITACEKYSSLNSIQMSGGRADWDNDLTKVFLDLCIAEKENFNYTKKGPTKIGWKNLHRNFRQLTGRCYDTKQLQNKFHNLKRVYKVWKKLKTSSGTGWDIRTGTITMDDNWWNDQIAVMAFPPVVIILRTSILFIMNLTCCGFLPYRRNR
jgi:hypothetical protein